MVQLATFRDTVSPQDMAIDGSFEGVIAYGSGEFAWPAAEIERFRAAGKHVYRYDVTGQHPELGSVLDVERFDATPAMAADWVPERNRLAGDAGCYVSLDNVPELLDALGGESAWLFVAHWVGHPAVPVLKLPPNIRFAGTQYQNLPGWDLIAVYAAGWLGRQA